MGNCSFMKHVFTSRLGSKFHHETVDALSIKFTHHPIQRSFAACDVLAGIIRHTFLATLNALVPLGYEE